MDADNSTTGSFEIMDAMVSSIESFNATHTVSSSSENFEMVEESNEDNFEYAEVESYHSGDFEGTNIPDSLETMDTESTGIESNTSTENATMSPTSAKSRLSIRGSIPARQLMTLPTELQLEIISHMNPAERTVLKLTCKYFYRFNELETLPSFFKHPPLDAPSHYHPQSIYLRKLIQSRAIDFTGWPCLSCERFLPSFKFTKTVQEEMRWVRKDQDPQAMSALVLLFAMSSRKNHPSNTRYKRLIYGDLHCAECDDKEFRDLAAERETLYGNSEE
ncbi:hypothetical protein M501DRAFT_1013012 [Patellaria atrata CBS 101060]|uniref:F-box domain-containing protein n=1 Tax=Patellaria atrata CBS 101060 TaxID=1346257 RepID=A0A9P4SJD3_9PEZI|nr:hypothetical protein M501DRAFT_1013012 [Patellaria atrata CBS 101060]